MANPRILSRLENITVELAVLTKHATQYSGIDKGQAKRVLVETKHIIECAKILQALAEKNL